MGHNTTHVNVGEKNKFNSLTIHYYKPVEGNDQGTYIATVEATASKLGEFHIWMPMNM